MSAGHLQSPHSSRLNGMCVGNIPLHLLHGNEVLRQIEQAAITPVTARSMLWMDSLSGV